MKSFLVNVTQTLSLIGQVIHILVSSQCSSDSDDMNIRATKRQKILVVDSDTESGHETDQCWGMYSLLLLKSRLKTMFHEN